MRAGEVLPQKAVEQLMKHPAPKRSPRKMRWVPSMKPPKCRFCNERVWPDHKETCIAYKS